MRALIFYSLLLMFSSEAFAVVPSFSSDRDRATFYQLTHEIRCVVCQNQSIAESNAPLANDLRRKVHEQLSQGKSEREIKQYLVERYGDSILFSPPFNAKTALLWLFPFLLLVGVASFFMFHKASKR